MLLPSNGTASCDPGQPLYEYRNFAWVVGDSLSLLASIIVLCAVSASSELHALAARRSVINLCLCDIVFHASDLIFTPLQIFYGWGYACTRGLGVFVQFVQALYVAANVAALLWTGGVALSVAMSFHARSDAPPPALRYLPHVIWTAVVGLLLAFGASCALTDSCRASSCTWPFASASNYIARVSRIGGAAVAFLATGAAGISALLRTAAPAVVRDRLARRLGRFLLAFVIFWTLILLANNLKCGDGYPGPGYFWFWCSALVAYQGLINATLLSAQSLRSALRRSKFTAWMVEAGPTTRDSLSRYVAFDVSSAEQPVRRGSHQRPPRLPPELAAQQ